MSAVGRKCTTGTLVAVCWLAIGSIGIDPAFGRTADGAAEGVNLQAGGIVDVELPLVSVAASGVDAFDESDEVLGVDETIPLLGSIAADVISAATLHLPFDHLVASEAIATGLEVGLGIEALGVGIPILDLGSGTIASQAEVTGSCDAFSAVGGATIEDLTISVLGLDQGVAVPINPPPNFEVLNTELNVPIGLANVTAQVLVIANEQDVAADESDISVNALRVTIGLEITVLAVTVEQDVNLVIAHSQAAFENCNEVDLSVEKTTSLDGNATTGEPFQYTVTVGNNSLVDATAIEITDQLPPELEFISFIEQSGGDCSHDSGLITCQWLTVPAGTDVSVTYEVMPVAAGTVTNSVGVSTGDVNTGDTGDEVEIIIDQAVDLEMEKSIDNEPLVVGQVFNYVFDYTNFGVNDATQVDFADLVPDGIAITSAPAGGDCTVDGAPAVFPLEGDGMTVLVCVIQVTVPAGGGMAQVLLPALPLAQSEGTVPVNYASWSDEGGGNPDDPDPGTCETDPNCDTSEPEEPVQPPPSVVLVMEKSIDNQPLVVGQAFNYVFDYTNTGVEDAAQVDFADLIPDGIAITSAPAGGDCTVDGAPAVFPLEGDGMTVLVCVIQVAVPANGGMAQVLLPALPLAQSEGTVPVNYASWSDEGGGNPDDPDPGTCETDPNCDTSEPEDPVQPPPSVVLVMEKSIDNQPLVVGQAFNYVFDYTNTGVEDAAQVDFADLVPDGIAITSAPAGGDCTVDGAPAVFPLEGDGMTVLVCVIQVAVPANGGMAQVLLPALPLAQSEGTVPVNYASWSDQGGGNPDDPDPGTCETDPNCDSSQPDDPVQPALFVDLEVEMSIDGEPLIVGQPFDYVFTYTNNGNIGATQVDFAALLPFGIEITGPPDGGICTVDGTPAEFPVVGDDETLLECLVITTVPADGGMAVVTLPAVATEAGEQPVIHVGWSDEGNGNPEIPNPGCADNINCATVAPAEPIGTGVELVMEKSIDNEPLVVGQVFNYVFDYTNNGVNDATQVDFADLVPDGIAITSAPVDGTCTVDGDPAAFPVEGDGVIVLVCVIGVTVPADGGMAQVLLPAMPLAQSEGTTPVNYASWSDEGGGDPDDPDPGTCETDPNCDSSEPEDPVQPGSVNDIFSDRFEQ